MASRRLRGEFDCSVDGATKLFTDELDGMPSVHYSVEEHGKSTAIHVGFVELATWVYLAIALLLGLVLALFLVPDEYLPTFLADLEPVLGISRWWAVILTIIILAICYGLSQVTTVIPGGEVTITPDGPDASNVEVRDVTESYMYRTLRNIVHDNDRDLSAARAKAEENQITLGSVFGAGMAGVASMSKGERNTDDREADPPAQDAAPETEGENDSNDSASEPSSD